MVPGHMIKMATMPIYAKNVKLSYSATVPLGRKP